MSAKSEPCKKQKNEGVFCRPEQRNCDRCGWNPAVAQARLEKFCQERGISVPRLKNGH